MMKVEYADSTIQSSISVTVSNMMRMVSVCYMYVDCAPVHAGSGCRICRKNTYSEGGLANKNLRCMKCPEGYTTEEAGATSAEACVSRSMILPLDTYPGIPEIFHPCWLHTDLD